MEIMENSADKSLPQSSESILKLGSSINVRNICVLAHVDHGKTTLVDCLLASNGIISHRMAGKLRYMDSRPDEQQRGITMKSSSISLIFEYPPEKKFLINVIDSPGHVDFFGEVSTALKICDGCIIIVDVIEGVCSQTRAAMQQAWFSRVRPILVLNKIDRLFVEKKLDTLDIYIQLTQILEQVNACVGELFASDVLSKISSSVENCQESDQTINVGQGSKSKKQVFYDWSSGLDDIDDSGVYFSPENGNVIFASAIDGWGFTITDFARILSSKLGFSQNVLKKTLWGDFYINNKEKRIMKGAQSKAKKPLFVTLVLENLSKIYEKFLMQHDKQEMVKMAETLGIKLLARDVERSDHRMTLMQLFSQWMPLNDSLLKTVCDVVPSPCCINEERVERLMSANQTRRFDSLPPETRSLKQAFLACQPSQPDNPVPLIVYVTKMFSFPRDSLPQFRIKPLTPEEIAQRRELLKKKAEVEIDKDGRPLNSGDIEDRKCLSVENDSKVVFIGFSRVFSGTIRRNDFVYVIGPKHDPTKVTPEMIKEIDSLNLTLTTLRSDQHVTKVQIKDLYLLMGRDLEYVEEVHAGHICGIGNLEAHVIKSATLSSTVYCPPFIDNVSSSVPILRVAVEPKNPSDMPALINALRMLNQSDPCVDVKIQESGEHVIITTGEVHLERCIVDLENFLGEEIEFNISDPIVPFRETIVTPPKVDTLNEVLSEQKIINAPSQKQKELIEQITPNKKFLVGIRAKPLPESVTLTLDSNKEILKQLMEFQRTNVLQDTNTNYVSNYNDTFTLDVRNAIHDLRFKLEQQFNEAGWPSDTIDRVWSFGPKFFGPNLMLNQLKDFNHRPCFLLKEDAPSAPSSSTVPEMEKNDIRYVYENSFINGFQLCTQSGPLCDEPMMGVCFIVEEWKYLETDESSAELTSTGSDPFGPISGQIMSTVKETCRRAFQAQPQRLMAAMFSCIIQINSDALGKMYAVLGRRHGRILHADLQEGSQTFTVNAVLPVIESFKFANEIRKQTSGKAIPQLAFSHWEVIDIDPFWTPTTEEEYKLYGEKADTENRALLYMNAVRKRKGLHVEEKIVEHAEKQRTLTKNK